MSKRSVISLTKEVISCRSCSSGSGREGQEDGRRRVEKKKLGRGGGDGLSSINVM